MDQPSSPTHNARRWYENAVFYQVMVGTFYDDVGQGTGTLNGVSKKLDYLQDLGVDCVWLSPFFASPRRDDGYDIADYRRIHPDYGTMADFENLVEQVHQRGMHIIIDLALNHTSSDHEWFQQSRFDPTGPFGDYYVWGDDPNRYPEIRVIFTDVETSNWTWDTEREQYYFHRFYSHQPDLNYDNPAVHAEIYSIVDFWMNKGIDGFRLDAIPYLYERDGLGGESLPETLEFLTALRAHMDKFYPDAVMVAEANQPPAPTREFFGAGDRVQMIFNFPLMPRMFQAMATSRSAPISEIMRELTDLPVGCQWGNFVRNHDELTLEMVSGPERDLMYSAYLPDDSMRAHVGIARRLAPLLDNDPAKITAMFNLLFSLPGTPFLYYGEELGMVDDTSLPDRYAVRTPMQWDPSEGGGFTTSLAPVRRITGGKGLDVASQINDPASLLSSVKKMIAVRKATRALQFGRYAEVSTAKLAILAYTRTLDAQDAVMTTDPYSTQSVLCITNFAPHSTMLDKDLLQPLGGEGRVIAASPSIESELAQRREIRVEPGFEIPGHSFLWLS
ncbi:MAG: alpha-amylase family protein [Corynebacterium sp.]|nr:alpha-amylase family protein [Corynebacterium sp.]